MKTSPNQAQSSGYSFSGNIQSATNKKARIPVSNKKALLIGLALFLGFGAFATIPIVIDALTGGYTPNVIYAIFYGIAVLAGLFGFFATKYPNVIKVNNTNYGSANRYQANASQEHAQCLTDPTNINGDAMLVKESLGLI